MKKLFSKSLKFTIRIVSIYIIGFIIALIVFALLSEYLKNKQYTETDKTEIKGYDFSKFTFLDADAKLFEMSEFKGKFVLLDFWFSGCKPCLSEMTSLAELADDNPTDFAILSISIEDLSHMFQFINKKREENDFRFKKRPNWTFANIAGKEQILDELKLRVYPTYFIINKDGVIVDRLNTMPVLKTKKYLSSGASIKDYIESYHSVMPCGGLKKYLTAYTIALFLPGFVLFLIIFSIILLIRYYKKPKIKTKNVA